MPNLLDSVRPAFRKLPPSVAMQAQKRLDYLQQIEPFSGPKLGWRVMGVLMAYSQNRMTKAFGKRLFGFRGAKKRWGVSPSAMPGICSSCARSMRFRGYLKAG